MPGSLTLLDYNNVGSGATSIPASTSISPSANALVIFILQARSIAPSASGLTLNFNAVSNGQGRTVNYWNNEESTPWDGSKVIDYGTDLVGVQVATCVTTGSPGSGTPSWSFSTSSNRAKLWIFEITSDFNAVYPIRQWNFSGTASGVTGLTDDLPLAPLSTSRLVSFGFGRAATTTVAPDTDWTEVAENTDNSHAGNVQTRTGTTATQYGISFGATESNGVAIGCIEIRATGDSPDEQPTVLTSYHFSSAAGSSYVIPETGSVSPAADAWVFVPCVISDVTGTTRSVSSISSAFSVTGSGWQRLMTTTAVGNDDVLIEWWYAQAASSPGSGAVTITYDGSYTGVHGAAIVTLPSTATDDPSAGATAQATSASLSGGTPLNGTLTGLATTSLSLVAGFGLPVSNQAGVVPAAGYELIWPPAEEGDGTFQMAFALGDVGTTFGGLLSASGNDQTDGACFAAIEIPLPATGITQSVGQVSETDLAQAISARKIQSLGQISETDLAQAITAVKRLAAGQATETDTAQPVSTGIIVPVGQVTETDLAQAFSILKALEVSGVNETDTAQQLAAQRVIQLAQAEEHTIAASFPASKARTLAQVSDTEVAQALTHAKQLLVGQITETDLAQAVDPELRRLVGQITETDVALAVVQLTGIPVNQVVETDTALPIGVQRVVALAQATSSEEAFAVAVSKAKTLGIVTETDLAQAITRAGVGNPKTLAITGVWNPIKSLTGQWN